MMDEMIPIALICYPRATVLMNDLLETPDDFFNHISRYTASVATSTVYGFRAPTFQSFWGHVSSTKHRGTGAQSLTSLREYTMLWGRLGILCISS